MNLQPFQVEHLADAAKLLAARHHCDLEAHPSLPPRFAEFAHARSAIETCWLRDLVNGAVAIQDGEMLG